MFVFSFPGRVPAIFEAFMKVYVKLLLYRKSDIKILKSSSANTLITIL